ncbi:MAG: hypothetical protein ABIG69_15110 [Bacteroidota bacterium]
MTRIADYAIQGFLYQFNKTILEILQSSGDSNFTIEGIIEDIDVVCKTEIRAIQCKYHEEQQNFTLSLVYKPILQMMLHFQKNEQLGVKYILYAYFPNMIGTGTYQITNDQIDAILKTQNKDLEQYTNLLRDKINIQKFLKHFTFDFGQSLEKLVNIVYSVLKDNGIPEADIETLVYPNAIQTIANLSIKHDENLRKITKSQFLKTLKQIRKTAISRWTLSLKSYKEILRARKKQLKSNLDKNARLRYFLVRQSSIEDFKSDIVLFISDYLDKYHFKTAHIKTPLFCLDFTQDDFNDVRLRLHQKGIIAVDGFVGGYFDKAWFFREPMSRKSGKAIEREFKIRILRYVSNYDILTDHKSDDLFIIGEGKYDNLNVQDVNVECLAVTNFKEVKYLLGVSNVYE